jgi:hypothetical protein
LRVLALVALLGWYGLGLFQEAMIPAAPDPFARLEAFLRHHHLTAGVGGYWNSSVITVDTGGAVTIRAVTQGCLQPYAWESKPAWYDPAGHTASFVLESSGTGYFSQWQASPAALRRLGALIPAASRATLDPGEGYTVHAYQETSWLNCHSFATASTILAPKAVQARQFRPVVMNVPPPPL